MEAKERFLQLKSDHEKDVNQRNIAVIQNENRLKQIENNLKQKTDALTKKDSDLDQVKQSLEKQQENLTVKQQEADKALLNQQEILFLPLMKMIQ